MPKIKQKPAKSKAKFQVNTLLTGHDKSRLERYIESQPVPPSEPDVIRVALREFLDRAERHK